MGGMWKMLDLRWSTGQVSKRDLHAAGTASVKLVIVPKGVAKWSENRVENGGAGGPPVLVDWIGEALTAQFGFCPAFVRGLYLNRLDWLTFALKCTAEELIKVALLGRQTQTYSHPLAAHTYILFMQLQLHHP